MQRPRTMRTSRLAILAVLPLMAASACGQEAAAARGQGLLFDDSSIFEVTMQFDFEAICMNPVEQDCKDVPGVISYTGADGTERRIDIRLRTRGRWNPQTARCDFPSLFVYFDSAQSAGTVFEGEKMLPLTTHCRHSYSNYLDYVQTEYLAHRIYNLLTDVSLRTRFLNVTYADTQSRKRRTRYGFFVEHFDKLAARTDRQWVDVGSVDLNRVRPDEMATLSLFQYLIANLDWSALQPHNVAIFVDEDDVMTPVPYDFDYSGIVYTPYANPPRDMPVFSVTTRHYRGLCWPDQDWDGLFERFRQIEDGVFEEFARLPRVRKKEQRRVRFFLERFFEILDTEKDRRKKIIDACRPIPESMLGEKQ